MHVPSCTVHVFSTVGLCFNCQDLVGKLDPSQEYSVDAPNTWNKHIEFENTKKITTPNIVNLTFGFPPLTPT